MSTPQIQTTPSNSLKLSQNMANIYEQFKKKMTSLDEQFQSFLIFVIMVIIVVVYLSYLFYLSILKSRQCNNMNTIFPDVNGYIVSVSNGNPQYAYKLYDYYISTAYNACSGGDYKNNFVDTCILKSIIKQGVRCLDFEIYSIDNQPVVATSIQDSFYIKETFNSVPFGGANSVMEIIDTHAFAGGTCPNPTDPLIIHLRIKSTNQAMFENLANIFTKYDKMLGVDYSFEKNGKNLGSLPLLTFMGKIILIIDRSNTAFLQCDNLLEYVNITSNSIFMRGISYFNIKNGPDVAELTDFNKTGMTIVFPDKESNPPNPSGLLCRTYGCQMTAMRYQFVDDFLMENIQFFSRGGSAFVLKPVNLRFTPIILPDPKPQNPNFSYATRTFGNQYYTMNV
jgi:hypothetical protein